MANIRLFNIPTAFENSPLHYHSINYNLAKYDEYEFNIDYDMMDYCMDVGANKPFQVQENSFYKSLATVMMVKLHLDTEYLALFPTVQSMIPAHEKADVTTSIVDGTYKGNIRRSAIAQCISHHLPLPSDPQFGAKWNLFSNSFKFGLQIIHFTEYGKKTRYGNPFNNYYPYNPPVGSPAAKFMVTIGNIQGTDEYFIINQIDGVNPDLIMHLNETIVAPADANYTAIDDLRNIVIKRDKIAQAKNVYTAMNVNVAYYPVVIAAAAVIYSAAKYSKKHLGSMDFYNLTRHVSYINNLGVSGFEFPVEYIPNDGIIRDYNMDLPITSTTMDVYTNKSFFIAIADGLLLTLYANPFYRNTFRQPIENNSSMFPANSPKNRDILNYILDQKHLSPWMNGLKDSDIYRIIRNRLALDIIKYFEMDGVAQKNNHVDLSSAAIIGSMSIQEHIKSLEDRCKMKIFRPYMVRHGDTSSYIGEPITRYNGAAQLVGGSNSRFTFSITIAHFGNPNSGYWSVVDNMDYVSCSIISFLKRDPGVPITPVIADPYSMGKIVITDIDNRGLGVMDKHEIELCKSHLRKINHVGINNYVNKLDITDPHEILRYPIDINNMSKEDNLVDFDDIIQSNLSIAIADGLLGSLYEDPTYNAMFTGTKSDGSNPSEPATGPFPLRKYPVNTRNRYYIIDTRNDGDNPAIKRPDVWNGMTGYQYVRNILARGYMKLILRKSPAAFGSIVSKSVYPGLMKKAEEAAVDISNCYRFRLYIVAFKYNNKGAMYDNLAKQMLSNLRNDEALDRHSIFIAKYINSRGRFHYSWIKSIDGSPVLAMQHFRFNVLSDATSNLTEHEIFNSVIYENFDRANKIVRENIEDAPNTIPHYAFINGSRDYIYTNNDSDNLYAIDFDYDTISSGPPLTETIPYASFPLEKLQQHVRNVNTVGLGKYSFRVQHRELYEAGGLPQTIFRNIVLAIGESISVDIGTYTAAKHSIFKTMYPGYDNWNDDTAFQNIFNASGETVTYPVGADGNQILGIQRSHIQKILGYKIYGDIMKKIKDDGVDIDKNIFDLIISDAFLTVHLINFAYETSKTKSGFTLWGLTKAVGKAIGKYAVKIFDGTLGIAGDSPSEAGSPECIKDAELDAANFQNAISEFLAGINFCLFVTSFRQDKSSIRKFVYGNEIYHVGNPGCVHTVHLGYIQDSRKFVDINDIDRVGRAIIPRKYMNPVKTIGDIRGMIGDGEKAYNLINDILSLSSEHDYIGKEKKAEILYGNYKDNAEFVHIIKYFYDPKKWEALELLRKMNTDIPAGVATFNTTFAFTDQDSADAKAQTDAWFMDQIIDLTTKINSALSTDSKKDITHPTILKDDIDKATEDAMDEIKDIREYINDDAGQEFDATSLILDNMLDAFDASVQAITDYFILTHGPQVCGGYKYFIDKLEKVLIDESKGISEMLFDIKKRLDDTNMGIYTEYLKYKDEINEAKSNAVGEMMKRAMAAADIVIGNFEKIVDDCTEATDTFDVEIAKVADDDDLDTAYSDIHAAFLNDVISVYNHHSSTPLLSVPGCISGYDIEKNKAISDADDLQLGQNMMYHDFSLGDIGTDQLDLENAKYAILIPAFDLAHPYHAKLTTARNNAVASVNAVNDTDAKIANFIAVNDELHDETIEYIEKTYSKYISNAIKERSKQKTPYEDAANDDVAKFESFVDGLDVFSLDTIRDWFDDQVSLASDYGAFCYLEGEIANIAAAVDITNARDLLDKNAMLADNNFQALRNQLVSEVTSHTNTINSKLFPIHQPPTMASLTKFQNDINTILSDGKAKITAIYAASHAKIFTLDIGSFISYLENTLIDGMTDYVAKLHTEIHDIITDLHDRTTDCIDGFSAGLVTVNARLAAHIMDVDTRINNIKSAPSAGKDAKIDEIKATIPGAYNDAVDMATEYSNKARTKRFSIHGDYADLSIKYHKIIDMLMACVYPLNIKYPAKVGPLSSTTDGLKDAITDGEIHERDRYNAAYDKHYDDFVIAFNDAKLAVANRIKLGVEDEIVTAIDKNKSSVDATKDLNDLIADADDLILSATNNKNRLIALSTDRETGSRIFDMKIEEYIRFMEDIISDIGDIKNEIAKVIADVDAAVTAYPATIAAINSDMLLLTNEISVLAADYALLKVPGTDWLAVYKHYMNSFDSKSNDFIDIYKRVVALSGMFMSAKSASGIVSYYSDGISRISTKLTKHISQSPQSPPRSRKDFMISDAIQLNSMGRVDSINYRLTLKEAGTVSRLSSAYIQDNLVSR